MAESWVKLYFKNKNKPLFSIIYQNQSSFSLWLYSEFVTTRFWNVSVLFVFISFSLAQQLKW